MADGHPGSVWANLLKKTWLNFGVHDSTDVGVLYLANCIQLDEPLSDPIGHLPARSI